MYGQEAGGHAASTIRKQGEMNAGALLARSAEFIAHGTVLPTVRMGMTEVQPQREEAPEKGARSQQC